MWIGDKSNLLKSPAEEIARTLEGSRIECVRRVGKHIVIDLHRDHGGSASAGDIVQPGAAQWLCIWG